ncbi:MAG: pirin family protein [Acidimicrobiia bacterium]|nr:pirin family protein [Acidimicrobiia bacterium]
MSGPVTPADAQLVGAHGTATPPTLEVLESRVGRVGAVKVRRALPRRGRRTVGAWCFADHMGPASVTPERSIDVGPHPHIGLQTVTWLTAGEILHRDSLGSEQVIRPGQLNLMTAGAGVSHSEEASGYRGELEGIQLWVAQPEATRHGAPAFEHHADLPQVDLLGATATVVVGELAGATSPARRDTDHVGLVLAVRAGRASLPLRAEYEHCLVVLDGEVEVDGTVVAPGQLAYLGTGRDELVPATRADATAMLLGGLPFEDDVLMWWNYVGRTTDEIDAAHRSWQADDGRFGRVASPLARISASAPPWAAADRD